MLFALIRCPMRIRTWLLEPEVRGDGLGVGKVGSWGGYKLGSDFLKSPWERSAISDLIAPRRCWRRDGL
jgi:hypothetical protein